MSIRLVLPLPPTTNHIYVRRRNGYELCLSEAARACPLFVNRAVADLELPDGFRLRPPLRVTVHLVLATRRRRDLDNSCKVLLDSLAVALNFDDDGIVDLHLTKTVERKGQERCEVTIEEVK